MFILIITNIFYGLIFLFFSINKDIMGLVTLYRNKNAALIIILCILLFLFLVVIVFRHITIYFVYSSGIGPLLLIGVIILAIVILFLKGYK